MGQMMPGPLAAQAAMWFGYLQGGSRGALAVALPFVIPPALMVTAVAVLYAEYQGLSWVHDIFRGVGPAVLAIIAIAAVKLARTTAKCDPVLWTIAAPVHCDRARGGEDRVAVRARRSLRRRHYGGGLPRHSAASISPAALLAAVKGLSWTGSDASLGPLAFFFVKAGAFTFGSGLAIVPFLHEGLVEDRGWLTEQQFVDAVAMGLIRPRRPSRYQRSAESSGSTGRLDRPQPPPRPDAACATSVDEVTREVGEHIKARNPHPRVAGSRLMIGETDGGRTLTVVIQPDADDASTWHVMTGWQASPRERDTYRKQTRRRR